MKIFAAFKIIIVYISVYTVTTQKPIQAFIYEVKKSERGESYKKKLCWALRELRVFDAKYVSGKVKYIYILEYRK